MRRKVLVAGAAALVVLIASAVGVHADPMPQSEKCDDLQTRCLHRENGLCVVWHDECLVIRNHATHGPKRSKYPRKHKI